jgi:alkylation response protein AidB-like acyl-CoA dehydrogenase
MELRFTDEENAFRAEVRAFIDAALPAALRRKMHEGRALAKHEIVGWQRVLNEKGWATPSWPKACGGPGWSAVQRWIFLDELHQAPAPEPLSFNVNMIGPVLFTFGTDAQQQRFLPRIANLDDWWCQGFSEPGAGSDLASLACRAERDGDEWIVNGQKVWSSGAQFSEWGELIARSDPDVAKHKGMTAFMVPMDTAGIEVRPRPSARPTVRPCGPT